MNWPKRNWTKYRVEARKLPVFLLFGCALAVFLLFACSQKKPTETQKINNRPELLSLANHSVPENQPITFALLAFDVDGTVPKLAAFGAPKNAVFTDSANGRGSFDWTPAFSQEGNYTISFVASDGALADTEQVIISVGNVNRTPLLQPVDSQVFLEGSPNGFRLHAVDPDGDSLFLSADSIPPGVMLVDSLNGRAGVFWTPNFNQSGEYQPLFSVTDGLAADTKRVRFQVLEFDRSPLFNPFPGQQGVVEGQLLAFSVAADDPDGTAIQLTVQGLPLGATFTDSANGRGGFRWLTKVLQAGTYNIIFTAKSGALADTQLVSVRVDTARITYVNHIKAILDTRCTPCHFPGGQMCGTVCFNTYAGAFQWRERIRIRTGAGTMPPVPGGLPQGKRDTINAWVLRGALQL